MAIEKTDNSAPANAQPENQKIAAKTNNKSFKYKSLGINTKQKGIDIEQHLTKEEFKQLEEVLWELFRKGIELDIIYSQGEY